MALSIFDMVGRHDIDKDCNCITCTDVGLPAMVVLTEEFDRVALSKHPIDLVIFREMVRIKSVLLNYLMCVVTGDSL